MGVYGGREEGMGRRISTVTPLWIMVVE